MNSSSREMTQHQHHGCNRVLPDATTKKTKRKLEDEDDTPKKVKMEEVAIQPLPYITKVIPSHHECLEGIF